LLDPVQIEYQCLKPVSVVLLNMQDLRAQRVMPIREVPEKGVQLAASGFVVDGHGLLPLRCAIQITRPRL